nr:PQQ-binding-like beta-propeller repeat protein [uncultured Campylobacter sp.]
MQNQEREALKKEWNEKGEKYAKAVNDMVAFAEAHGWDAYKGEEPVDERAHLGEAVFALLKEANERGETAKFRADFPPSNVIFEDEADDSDEKDKIGDKLGNVDQICPLGGENVLFVVSQSYPEGWRKKLYLLEGERVSVIAEGVIAVGKSKRNEIYALLRRGEIELVKGYDGKGGGEPIAKFSHDVELTYDEAEILPFNDGKKVLLVAHDGIFLISQSGAKLIHPIYEDEDDDGNAALYIDMANATLSNDNALIVAGEQCDDHILMDSEGERLGDIGAQSSYPHFCLFSADDTQLITNSCHFYNGVTIGVDRALLKRGVQIYRDRDFTLVDDEMRVYAGVATQDFYILGDAYGYIRAVGKDGRKIWRHYLGGTIKSMAISEDGGVLFVGTYGGRLHKLRLGAGQDSHTISNGNHKEEFRLIAFEDKIYRW